jgi:ABC-2 type transport system ATP-binding protein
MQILLKSTINTVIIMKFTHYSKIIMKSQIKVENLTRKFYQKNREEGFKGAIKSFLKPQYKDITAVKDISFEINEGELIGFIGPNGAGKTTTLKMLTGLIHPTSGTVKVMGYTPYERDYAYLKKIALVMGQKMQLLADIPAMECFLLNKDIYEIEDEPFKAVVKEVSELLEITHVLNVPVRNLSLGERMKCELLASLIHQPKVLFLDEPTIGLDIQSQKRLRLFLKELNRKFKTTIILTSHNMDDVEEVCDRLIVINHGELMYDGDRTTLIKSYADEKQLIIELKKPVEKALIEEYGKILDFNESNFTISVPRKDHTAIAADILKKFDVDNLDIAERSLEDIISSMYESRKAKV